MRIDLHMHTTLSDGYRPVAEQAALVAKRRLELWAITDHDSCAAWPAVADQAGVVCGVEVTSWAGQEVHIVGLGVDPEAAALADQLLAIRQGRWRRMAQLCDWLQSSRGWQIEAEALREDRATGDDAVVTRSHLAGALVRAGHLPHAGAVFAEVLGDKHLGHLEDPAYPTPEEACAAIQAAGGVAILAHPAHYHDIHLVERLLGRGLDGLEIKHPGCSPPLSRLLRQLAADRGLLISCGSDDHGRMPCRIGDWRLSREDVAPLLERLRGTSGHSQN